MLGLPSLGEFDRHSSLRIWLAREPADMRCGFDRLAQLAASITGQDPLSGHLFLFRSRGGDRLKVLLWERDGFWILYKRLEAGTFRFPRIGDGQMSVQIKPSELAMLLEGIDLSSVRRRPRYEVKKIEASAEK
jgi:transposase